MESPAIESPPHVSVVWDGPTQSVQNRFGTWKMGVPRNDITHAQIAQLGPGFRILWTAGAAKTLDDSLPDRPIPEGRVGWATAWAHWGDTLACMGYAKWLLDQKGQKSCDFIYTGPDDNMVEFLLAQPWIRRVLRGDNSDNQRYMRAYCEAAYDDAVTVSWFSLIMTPEFPDLKEITPTHPSLHQSIIYKCRPLKEVKLPAKRVAKAKSIWDKQVAPRLKSGPVIMVHPISVWSESAENHWPYMKEAIAWLLEHTPFTFVLTGLEEGFAVPHERLINLVGQTPSCMEVFALADMCDGLLSTCNSLSLWNVTSGKPALICGNRVMDNLGYFFRRFVDRPPNRWLNVNATFDDFKGEAAGWIDELTVKPVEQIESKTMVRRSRSSKVLAAT